MAVPQRISGNGKPAGKPVTEGLPPGPRLPRPVAALNWTFRPIRFLEKCAERYGDCFTVQLPPPAGAVVHVHNPEGVKQVFTGDPEALHAGEVNAIELGSLLGENSLLTLDGQRHLRERRLMLPPFHGERMTQYGETMARIARESLAGWPVGRPFAMRERFRDITLEVILSAVFGLEPGPRTDSIRAAVAKLMTATDHWAAAIPILQRRLPGWSPWKRFVEARATVDDLLYAEIGRRRGELGGGERIDIMSMLLTAEYEDGARMTDREVRDELITLLAAGHETTTSGLSWTFELLFRNPQCQARLEEELASAQGEPEYLDAVIKEALRMRPVVPAVGRRLKAPFELNGYLLPAGAIVVPDIYLAHHRADTYPDPYRFRPERFIEEQAGTYTWFPFGGGVRRCVGASFATFEMKIVLREVLAHARLGPATPRPDRIVRRHVTIRPKRGTMAVLQGFKKPIAESSSAVAIPA